MSASTCPRRSCPAIWRGSAPRQYAISTYAGQRLSGWFIGSLRTRGKDRPSRMSGAMSRISFSEELSIVEIRVRSARPWVRSAAMARSS